MRTCAYAYDFFYLLVYLSTSHLFVPGGLVHILTSGHQRKPKVLKMRLCPASIDGPIHAQPTDISGGAAGRLSELPLSKRC